MFSQTRTRSPVQDVISTDRAYGSLLSGAWEHTMPVWHVLVRDSGGDVEHDNTALTVDVVSITETTKLLLAGSIPDVELDLTIVGVETWRG